MIYETFKFGIGIVKLGLLKKQNVSLQENNQRAPQKKYFLPNRKSIFFDKKTLEKWYQNLLFEVSQNNYPDWALDLLQDKRNYYGKYLEPYTREFFLNHFATNLTTTILFLINRSNSRHRILEIGSGCGNQLLLLAFMGLEVYGCDIRKGVCDLVQKRKEFYEKISGRKLNISIICEDVFKVDWDKWGAFDGINFLFSFNDIQPNERLLMLIQRLLKPGGRVVFQETNQSNYYNRIFRKRNSMTPHQVAETLKKNKFRIHFLRGGYALPPIFWRFLPRNILLPIDQILCKSLFMSPSYHLMAEKM